MRHVNPKRSLETIWKKISDENSFLNQNSHIFEAEAIYTKQKAKYKTVTPFTPVERKTPIPCEKVEEKRIREERLRERMKRLNVRSNVGTSDWEGKKRTEGRIALENAREGRP